MCKKGTVIEFFESLFPLENDYWSVIFTIRTEVVRISSVKNQERMKKRYIKAEELETKFEAGEDLVPYLDLRKIETYGSRLDTDVHYQ